MSLYKDQDVKLLKDNIDDILEDLKNRQLRLVEPYEQELREVTNILLTYLRENKRKCYGGFAINMLVTQKDKNAAIYKDNDFPDIDFYSPEPLQDLYRICNLLYDKGFKYIVGKEALHRETYSIFVNQHLYCDISYVPWNIYNKIPFKEIDGLYITGPNFIAIDYLRMLTDPLFSIWRIEKAFARFALLQKYYPLPHTENPIKLPKPKNPSVLETVNNFLIDRETTLTVGLYAFNYFLMNSGLLESKDKAAKKFSLLDYSYFEIISTNFREDTLALIELLKKEHKEKITVTEYYPFFQFFGHRAFIYADDVLVAIVYHYNKRCTPYLVEPAYKFTGGKATKLKGNIVIGTFSVVLMYALVTVIKARVDNDETRKQIYHDVVSQLIEMRNYYLNKNKKTIFDKTLFQDFVLECKGEMLDPKREQQLLYLERKKKNKYAFRYEPTPEKIIKEPDVTYRFANSSGNIVNNERNLKLTEKEQVEELEVEADTADKIVLDSRAAKNKYAKEEEDEQVQQEIDELLAERNE